MKKLLTEINDTIRQNKFNYLIILLFLCIGIVFGVCSVKYMNGADKNDLINYFNTFMEGTRNETINYSDLLFSVVTKVLFIFIPVLVLGYTFWGTPVILIIVFIKGFTLGYTFSFLINTLEQKGILLALASIIPQNIIYIPCLILISIISIKTANYRFRKRFLKNKNNSMIIEPCGKIIFTLMIFCAVAVLIETFICPRLIKIIVWEVNIRRG